MCPNLLEFNLTLPGGGGGPLIVVFLTCNPKDSIFISKINSELLQACSWWPAIGQANWSCQIWSICKHSYSPVSAWCTTKHLLDFSWGTLHCDSVTAICTQASELLELVLHAAGCRGLCNIKIYTITWSGESHHDSDKAIWIINAMTIIVSLWILKNGPAPGVRGLLPYLWDWPSGALYKVSQHYSKISCSQQPLF